MIRDSKKLKFYWLNVFMSTKIITVSLEYMCRVLKVANKYTFIFLSSSAAYRVKSSRVKPKLSQAKAELSRAESKPSRIKPCQAK